MGDTESGAPGPAAPAAATANGSGLLAALPATAGDAAPTFWGRLRVVPGGPRPVYHRDVTIQGDTARVEHDVTFEGLFLVDTSADRKSTRLNSSHGYISYAVFCLKKKK